MAMMYFHNVKKYNPKTGKVTCNLTVGLHVDNIEFEQEKGSDLISIFHSNGAIYFYEREGVTVEDLCKERHRSGTKY